MSEKESKEIKEIEEEDLDAEAIKILDSAINQFQKQVTGKKREEFLEKAKMLRIKGEEKTPEEMELDLQIQEFQYYFKFFLSMIVDFINPGLKKNGIDPITPEEIEELQTSISNFITKSILQKGSKITEKFSKIIDLPKIIKLIVSIWNIIGKRIAKFLKVKKKPGEIVP